MILLRIRLITAYITLFLFSIPSLVLSANTTNEILIERELENIAGGVYGNSIFGNCNETKEESICSECTL